MVSYLGFPTDIFLPDKIPKTTDEQEVLCQP